MCLCICLSECACVRACVCVDTDKSETVSGDVPHLCAVLRQVAVEGEAVLEESGRDHDSGPGRVCHTADTQGHHW